MDGEALRALLAAAGEHAPNALEALVSVAQGASNGFATSVTAPVDVAAWLLEQAGLSGVRPVGGEEWARAEGLIREPTNPLAAAVGEGLVYGALGLLANRPKKGPHGAG